MYNGENFREVDRAFIYAVMFQLGILPMENVKNDMRVPLNQLPAEESRALKRKFRKLWRKAMRAEIHNCLQKRELHELIAKKKYGVGKQNATRLQKNARKQLVFSVLWNDYIEPTLKKFENSNTKSDSNTKSR
jgi:hypothetical protein